MLVSSTAFPCPLLHPIHKNPSYTNTINHRIITAYFAVLNNQGISHWQLGVMVMEGEKEKNWKWAKDLGLSKKGETEE